MSIIKTEVPATPVAMSFPAQFAELPAEWERQDPAHREDEEPLTAEQAAEARAGANGLDEESETFDAKITARVRKAVNRAYSLRSAQYVKAFIEAAYPKLHEDNQKRLLKWFRAYGFEFTYTVKTNTVSKNIHRVFPNSRHAAIVKAMKGTTFMRFKVPAKERARTPFGKALENFANAQSRACEGTEDSTQAEAFQALANMIKDCPDMLPRVVAMLKA